MIDPDEPSNNTELTPAAVDRLIDALDPFMDALRQAKAEIGDQSDVPVKTRAEAEKWAEKEFHYAIEKIVVRRVLDFIYEKDK